LLFYCYFGGIEAPGVDPVFPEKHQAINYAGNRSGEIRILDSSGNVERTVA
jgi:hypothetical protein